jgi:hypothetical protein
MGTMSQSRDDTGIALPNGTSGAGDSWSRPSRIPVVRTTFGQGMIADEMADRRWRNYD